MKVGGAICYLFFFVHCTQWIVFGSAACLTDIRTPLRAVGSNSALSPAACQGGTTAHRKVCAVPRPKGLQGCAQLAELVFWPCACSTYYVSPRSCIFEAEAYESKRFSLTANRCLKEEAF